jgi:hypothetical protein
MSVLYITTFNNMLYQNCGRAMIRSFLDKKIDGELLIGYEDNIDLNQDFSKNNFLLHNLSADPILAKFLLNNSEYIPPQFGGAAIPCACKEPKIKTKLTPKERKKANQKVKQRKLFKGHFKACPWYGFNFRSSLWFRKIVILKHAIDNYPQHKTFFFVDADVIWKNPLSENELRHIMKEFQVGYMMGKRRKIAETGLVIYVEEGRNLIDIMLDEYMSGRYRELDRWDDSSVFTHCLNSNRKIPRIDLASKSNHASDVVQDSILHNYCEHRKGTNTVLYGITPKRVRGRDVKQKSRK